MTGGGSLLSIIGPLSGVVVGATLTFLAQHLGLLRAFVVTRQMTYYRRISKTTITSKKVFQALESFLYILLALFKTVPE